MTNGWVDIKNTDMMLIMGGNPAGEPPLRIQMGNGSQAQPQRQNYFR